jgi:DNA-binding MurR/RpiR family transcriptional regulator
MGLMDRIRRHGEQLTASEQKLVQAILEDPELSAMLNAAEMAARADVHESTATRFAQKLGFRGYPELRSELRVESLSRRDAAARLERSVTRMRDRGILTSLIEDEIAALKLAQEALPKAKLEAAADAVWNSGKVYLFCRGHAQALGVQLSRRLRRYGKPVLMLDGESRDVAETLNTVAPGDILIATAFRKAPPLLNGVLAGAHAQQARRLLICDPIVEASAVAADFILSAARGRSNSEFQTLTVPMAIVNALILTIGDRHGAAIDEPLNRLSSLMDLLDG